MNPEMEISLRVGDMPIGELSGDSDNTLFIPCQDLTTREFVSLHTVSGQPDASGKFAKRWAKGTYGGVFLVSNALDCRCGHGRVNREDDCCKDIPHDTTFAAIEVHGSG